MSKMEEMWGWKRQERDRKRTEESVGFVVKVGLKRDKVLWIEGRDCCVVWMGEMPGSVACGRHAFGCTWNRFDFHPQPDMSTRSGNPKATVWRALGAASVESCLDIGTFYRSSSCRESTK